MDQSRTCSSLRHAQLFVPFANIELKGGQICSTMTLTHYFCYIQAGIDICQPCTPATTPSWNKNSGHKKLDQKGVSIDLLQVTFFIGTQSNTDNLPELEELSGLWVDLVMSSTSALKNAHVCAIFFLQHLINSSPFILEILLQTYG